MLINDSLWEHISILPQSSIPLYKQLSIALERIIRSGFLPVNFKLPGEYEFAERLGLSRTTIRKAIKDLENQGLIFRNKGQGTFVNSKTKWIENSKYQGVTKGKIIGVLVPNITNEIYPQIIEGIEENAQQHQSCVLTATSESNRDHEFQMIDAFINRSIDGLILEPAHSIIITDESPTIQLLRSLKIPVVLINNDIPAFDCPKVMIDDITSGLTATRYLIAHGHRRIAYIYKDSIKAALDRRNGYRIALEEAGIPFDSGLEFVYTEEDEINYPGYQITKNIVSQPELGITAIFYFNDDLAMQGIQALKSLNMQIPADISVIGHDDIPRASQSPVALTTMEHPKKLIGRWATDLLFECIEQPDRKYFKKLLIQVALVPRATVALPPKY